MIQDIQFWELLAGLGIFLFGILLLEESVKKLSGSAFKKLIRRSTSGRVKSIFAGTFATAVLQSSTAVSLMVLAFIGAGIMGLDSAIGVIIGSNLGTTFTSWIVAAVGFKTNIEKLALPFLGFGGLGLIFFGKSTKATNISKLLVGFGFLFMGLEYLKTGMAEAAQNFDLQRFSGSPLLIFVTVGFLFTAVVQSSSAAMAVILSLLGSGVIRFHDAAAMVIGTNLGTTITVILGTIGGQAAKKRVALSHFLFNFVTALVAFLLLPLLVRFIENTLSFHNDPVIGLALFHTFFNLLGVLIFLPLTGLFAKLVLRIVSESKVEVSKYIRTFSAEAPEVAVTAFHRETKRLFKLMLLYTLRMLKIDTSISISDDVPQQAASRVKSTTAHYEEMKRLEAELFTFNSRIQMHPLTEEDARALNRSILSVKSAMAAAKVLKDHIHHLEHLEQSEQGQMQKLIRSYKERWKILCLDLFRILELEEGKEHQNLVSLLSTAVDKDLEDFTRSITEILAEGDIHQDEKMDALALNRAYRLSANQMISAVRDVLPPENGIPQD